MRLLRTVSAELWSSLPERMPSDERLDVLDGALAAGIVLLGALPGAFPVMPGRCAVVHFGGAVGAVDAGADVVVARMHCVELKSTWTSLGYQKVTTKWSQQSPTSVRHLAAAGAVGLERAGLEQPVADVEDVDVLLDDDVAGERLVEDPVAERGRRGSDVARAVVEAARRPAW